MNNWFLRHACLSSLLHFIKQREPYGEKEWDGCANTLAHEHMVSQSDE